MSARTTKNFLITSLALGLWLVGCQNTTTTRATRDALSTDAGLSGTAQEMYERVKKVLDELRSEREALCPQNRALLEEIGRKLDSIRRDSSLTDAQKRSAATALIQSYQASIQKEQARMQSCIADHSTEWQQIDALEQPIREACLPVPTELPAAPAGNGGKAPPPPPPLDVSAMSPSQRQELVRKLGTDACTAAVSRVEQAL